MATPSEGKRCAASLFPPCCCCCGCCADLWCCGGVGVVQRHQRRSVTDPAVLVCNENLTNDATIQSTCRVTSGAQRHSTLHKPFGRLPRGAGVIMCVCKTIYQTRQVFGALVWKFSGMTTLFKAARRPTSRISLSGGYFSSDSNERLIVSGVTK